MMSVVLKIIDFIFASTDSYISILFVVLALLIIAEINKKAGPLPKYILISSICICLEYLLLDFAWRTKKSKIMLFILLLMLLFTIIYALVKYIRISCSLKRVVRFSKEESLDANLIEAWNETYDLKPSMMTVKQQTMYKRHRIFLRAKLGCFHGNEHDLHDFECGGRNRKAFFHFIQFIQYLAMGDIEHAYNEIKEAEALSNGDTDELLRSQILINRGLAYAERGMYQDADDAFIRAINFCESHKMKNTYLWAILYRNYAFNKTCLEKDISIERLDDIMKQFEKHLDFDQPMDYLNCFNVKLELLRQINAGRKELGEVVRSVFDYMQNSDIPDSNRCRFEASMARVIWSAQLDPTYVLESLSRDIDVLQQLPMPVRYLSYKDIELLFNDLHGDIVKRHEALKQRAFDYMQNQAESDLDQYRKSLPAEAVYERYFCFYELAGIQKRNPQKYQWSVVENYFKNASALYHENGLLIDEIMCDLALIDEGTGILNCDQYMRLVRKEELLQIVDEIECLLPKLEVHPVINEIALRMSFYGEALDDYTRLKKYYEMYRSTSALVSINHYAPWMHRYYMDVVFAVRVIYILDSIKMIRDKIDSFHLSNLAKAWFCEFDKNGGAVVHFVIGMLMGFENSVLLKQYVVFDDSMQIKKSREWIDFTELKLEIDVLHPDGIFFAPNQHPLQNGLERKENERALVYNIEIALQSFKEDEQHALQEVCTLINSELPSECPEISELHVAFDDVMLPVGCMK